MNEKKDLTIQNHFSNITDPRQAHKTAHRLYEMIAIMICAVISGADSWVDIETYGKSKKKWLKTFLELPNGIPSHDTFGRVFSMISAEEFESCFLSWVKTIAEQIEGVVAIDGKTVRRSHNGSTEQKAIHMVSAWASNNGVVLGQVKTDEKSNEITAIPKLLKLLQIEGCIVTIDAMGCQKTIAKEIVDQNADYVLALKGNQESLQDEVNHLFQSALEKNFEGMKWDHYETTEKNHGRQETRNYWTLLDLDAVTKAAEWPRLSMVGMVESKCLCKGEESLEYRFYISSLDGNAQKFAKAVRSHWGIENSLHWALDVAFREDDCRIRAGNAAEIFSIVRRISLNLIKKEKGLKVGMKAKRLRAGWDNDYLLKILSV